MQKTLFFFLVFTRILFAPDPERTDIYNSKYQLFPLLDSSKAADQAESTRYFEGEEREKFRIRVALDGKLSDAEGKLLSVQNVPFVMDETGHFYSFGHHDMKTLGAVKHSSFLSGESLAASGKWTAKDGIVVDINNGSKHYGLPEIHSLQQVLTQLHKAGQNPSQVSYKDERTGRVYAIGDAEHFFKDCGILMQGIAN